MLTPPDSHSNFDTYQDLLKRIVLHMQQNKVDDQLLEILQQAFNKELEQENILLSRPERLRLFRQAAKAVMTDMLAKIDRDSERK